MTSKEWQYRLDVFQQQVETLRSAIGLTRLRCSCTLRPSSTESFRGRAVGRNAR